jgi:hypothetical protein
MRGADPGQCRTGDCCTGCWNGSACLALGAQSRLACGSGGAVCEACPPCQVCNGDGLCVPDRETDRMECPGGRCVGGECCERCLTDGMPPACGPGTSNLACGRGGVECENCESTGLMCVDGMCAD